MGPSASRFCRACGDTLSPSAAFCPACGTAVDTPSTVRDDPFGRATGGHDGKFRRRLVHYRVAGWTVEREFDDRVVLVDRGIGSPALHVALLLSTGGVGNVAYAWYCHGPGAPRCELRTDGTVRRVDDATGGATSLDYPTLAGVIACFIGFALVTRLVRQWSFVLLAVLLLVTTLASVGALAARRVDDRQSPTTFGRKRTVTEREVNDRSLSCAVCDSPLSDGVERTFAERTYLAGLPVRTHESGTNRYCRRCTSDEERARDADGDRERDREFA
ncbi:zinc-ribbon domain-containing protein [Halogranum amylolyticum]|uniref:Zinc-ribbon domain-containing protein n=1 Tax=Halogranum amylolyticum TaxID=660520 RepID=A0A1H8SYY3_9EURY|nr:zinc ribbon domain-containing protein [Halogranum amylolyticum]SEO83564.1 zinc-ribbon domain-containing protein [Halogranum amylolyticum]